MPVIQSQESQTTVIQRRQNRQTELYDLGTSTAAGVDLEPDPSIGLDAENLQELADELASELHELNSVDHLAIVQAIITF